MICNRMQSGTESIAQGHRKSPVKERGNQGGVTTDNDTKVKGKQYIVNSVRCFWLFLCSTIRPLKILNQRLTPWWIYLIHYSLPSQTLGK